MTNFNSILSEYGVTVVDGVVMEGNNEYYYQQPYYLLPDVKYDSLTSAASDNYVFVPSAQGLQYPKASEEETEEGTESTDSGITYTELLSTSESAYVKKDVAALETLEKEDGDVEGPFALGLDVKKNVDEEKTTELVVYSCTGMFADNADQIVSGNNSNLFSGAITGLVDDTGEGTTVIPVKEYDSSTLTVSAAVMLAGAALGIIVVPVLLLIVGIVIWARRRKR